MTLNLGIPSDDQHSSPTITVIGVGGAGGNAVNNMIKDQLEGTNFVVANTDAQALQQSLASEKIQLGEQLTQGLGAGASPQVGKAAAEESINTIRNILEGSNMVFITAGMGGGTGTGAAPVIAQVAREMNVLTVGVVTKPFLFEGAKRMKSAEAGLAELEKYVDTLVVVPNQNLFSLASAKTTFADAFKMADDVLCCGVGSITDLVMRPGIINLDFADIMTVMTKMGKAMMGTGEAEGEARAIDAALAAISNPLLDVTSMKGAKGVLINITGGEDMTLMEVDEAANRIKQEVDDEANIIFGSAFSEELTGKLRVTIIATGINNGKNQEVVHESTTSIDAQLKQDLESITMSDSSLPVDPRVATDELNEALIEEAKADLEKLSATTHATTSNTDSALFSEKREPVSPPSRKFGSLWKKVTALTRTGILAAEEQNLDKENLGKELEYADAVSDSESDGDSFDIPTFLRRDQK